VSVIFTHAHTHTHTQGSQGAESLPREAKPTEEENVLIEQAPIL
jgi:hypothetical protein